MNIKKRKAKPPPTHRVLEIRENEGYMITVCGHYIGIRYEGWRSAWEETIEEVTCKRCLERLSGVPIKRR